MRGMSARALAVVVVGLLAANLIAFNALLRPATARLDLTEEREYTITQATRGILRDLPDQVTVYGYFSEKTHEKLAPLVPRIRDLLDEYRVHGRGNLLVELADPRESEALEDEVLERFGIRPAHLPVRTRWETGAQRAYFHLVVAYGDQYEALGLQDLISVEMRGSDVHVGLQNLEYQLTRAIQTAVRRFGTLGARLSELDEPIDVDIFLTGREAIPPEQEDVLELLTERAEIADGVEARLAERFPEGLRVRRLDPALDPEARQVAQRYGLQARRLSRQDPTQLYLDLVVRHGEQAERLPLLEQQDIATADIVSAIEGTLRRLLPGTQPRVGLVSDKPDIPPEQLMQMRMQGMDPPGDDFGELRRALRSGYEVVDVRLESGRPPLHVDCLLVLRPKEMSERAAFALDQYLMMGGRALVFLDQTEVDRESRERLQLAPIRTGLEALLGHYGIEQARELVLDDRNVKLLLPVGQRGGFTTYEEVGYPWLLDVRDDSLDRSSPALSGVDRVALAWASPLRVDAERQPDARFQTLIGSSDQAWTSSNLRQVEPTLSYDVPEATERQTLAVAIDGTLRSFWEGRRPPRADGEEDEDEALHRGEEPATLADAAEAGAAEAGPRGLEPVAASVESTRLVVLGDSDIVSDMGAQMLQSSLQGSGHFMQNLQLTMNLIDWMLVDEALIQIRSRGGRDRPLPDMTQGRMATIEVINYAVPLVLVLGFGLARFARRRRQARRQRPAREAEA